MPGKTRIMIYGPKNDGTYVVEFKTAEGLSERKAPAAAAIGNRTIRAGERMKRKIGFEVEEQLDERVAALAMREYLSKADVYRQAVKPCRRSPREGQPRAGNQTVGDSAVGLEEPRAGREGLPWKRLVDETIHASALRQSTS